jgi:hypothetical protein
MRLSWVSKYIYIPFLLSAIAASAQINPHKNIKWPASCGLSNQNVYNVVTGECISNGTAANPAGVNGQAQYNGSGNFAASPTLTFDSLGRPSITGNVNSMINPMNYGAKGDCVTDDTAAFTAAQTAAIALSIGNSLPGALILPKPPGGCYLINDMEWKGVSIEGLAPAGLGPASPKTYPVSLKNSPGSHDILHVPDPSLTAGSFRIFPGWSIRNIGFIVDNSAGGVRPHRWPGRWFDDGTMTSGSAVFQSSLRRASISCADIGQAIQVNGAGPAGANLVTTIQNVSPCWQSPSTNAWKIVTLAAAASTTVSNAHTYISVLGLPVTQTLGNAAIAQDLMDGNSGSWVGTLITGNYGKMENVSFTTTNGVSPSSPNNYPVGFFTQGIPWLYGIDVHNIFVNGFWFGIAQTGSELNSFLQSSSGDYEKWDHGLFFFNISPWLSYNGFVQHLSDLQIAGFAGPQVLQLANQAFDAAIGWQVENMGFETPFNQMNWGWVVSGGFHHFSGVSLTSEASGQIGYWEASNSICDCDAVNTKLDGFGNKFSIGSGPPSNFVERGINNQSYWNYNANPFNGLPPQYDTTPIPYKGSSKIVGRFTPDFINDGNPATPYVYDELLIWPQDVVFGSATPWASQVVTDATSPSGYYLNLTAGARFNQYAPYVLRGNSSNSLVVGTNLPSTGLTAVFSAKCPSAGNFKPILQTFGGSIINPTLSCTTSYQTYSVDVPWAGVDVGKPFYFGADGASPSTIQMAWIDLVPYKAIHGTLNGLAPTGGGAAIPTGPTTSTAGHVATFINSSGQIQDSGLTLNTIANIQISVIGGTPIAANTCSADLGPATMTGLLTTSTILFTPSVDVSAVTGFGSTGGISIVPWPAANALHYRYCNQTGSSVTPGTVTWNVSAR